MMPEDSEVTKEHWPCCHLLPSDLSESGLQLTAQEGWSHGGDDHMEEGWSRGGDDHMGLN